MKKSRKFVKKVISSVMVSMMLASILQCLPEITLKANAATSGPSTASYATKSQLMTSYDADPNTVNKGEMNLLYGGGDGTTIEGRDAKSWTPWMIVGSDSGVQGDNLLIFNHLGTINVTPTTYRNDSDGSNIAYDSSWGCAYSSAPIEVAANHYGSSDIRNRLNSLPEESRWFNDIDISLINPTTVTSTDSLNNCTYTTTDLCYLPAFRDGVFYGGSNDNLVIDTTYITSRAQQSGKTGVSCIPSRTPGGSNSTISGYANAGYFLSTPSWDTSDAISVTRSLNDSYTYLVNLNLSSVKFASIVPAPSAAEQPDAEEVGEKGIPSYTTAERQGLYLRLDGSSLISSTAEYNSSIIKIVPKSTDSGLVLLVQGNDGTSDWYYRKEISGTTAVTVTADTIKTVVGLSETPDLSNCKVWIEKIDEYYYAYAKEATSASHICYSALLTEQAKVEPTCTVDGTEKYWKCSCNKVYNDDTATVQLATPTPIAQLGHSMEDATCTTPSTCSRGCGYTEGSAKGHTYATTWSKNETKHWYAATCEHSTEVSEEEDHNFGANNICTICNYDKNNYNIIDGADSKWTKGTTSNLVIRGDGEFSKFLAVKVDGTAIDAANYEVTEGSTIITLKASYVAGLAVGSHVFAIEWTDGVATTTFEIKAQPVSKPTNPPASNEKDEVPKTGESNNMFFWILVTVVSACGFVLTGKKYCEK